MICRPELLGRVTVDEDTGEWRCALDAHTTLVAHSLVELQEALDLLEQRLREGEA